MAPSTRKLLSSSSTEGVSLADVPLNEDPVESKPHLKIVEEPEKMFRFRYKSEMINSHGRLMGRNSIKRIKTWPSVQLKNYPHEAIVTCTLVEVDTPKLHMHRLVVRQDSQDTEDPHMVFVDPQIGLIAQFQGMCIVKTLKKKKVCKGSIENRSFSLDEKQKMQKMCKREAQCRNQNSARLCFEAFNVKGNTMICDPVYSLTINNLHCSVTGMLKITHISRFTGECFGGDELFILVDKISINDIKVRFYEQQDGVLTWEAFAKFSKKDIHHQIALVIRTPAYKDTSLRKDVDVLLQLYRPSDGTTSEPWPYRYKAVPHFNKRRHTGVTSLSSLLYGPCPVTTPVSLSSLPSSTNSAAVGGFPKTSSAANCLPLFSCFKVPEECVSLPVFETDPTISDWDLVSPLAIGPYPGLVRELKSDDADYVFTQESMSPLVFWTNSAGAQESTSWLSSDTYSEATQEIQCEEPLLHPLSVDNLFLDDDLPFTHEFSLEPEVTNNLQQDTSLMEDAAAASSLTHVIKKKNRSYKFTKINRRSVKHKHRQI